MKKQTNLPAWDLTDLYSGIQDKNIEKDLADYKSKNQKLADTYKGKIAKLESKDFYKDRQRAYRCSS